MKTPKVRIARALGIPLTAKAARIMERRPSLPGQHGQSRRRSPSVYKTQLNEKQRLKAIFNVSESQMRRYFKESQSSTLNAGEVLLRLLETRIDNAVYRMGFAKTIYAARQYISHGHFTINGRRAYSASIRLKPGMEIAVREKSKTHPQIVEALTHSASVQVPEYYEVNKVKMTGKLVSPPTREQIPVQVNEQFVVEYYSK
jgi:small subunit ribosomal protein S4